MFFNTGCSFQDRGGIFIDDGNNDRHERQYRHAQPQFEFGHTPHNLPRACANWQKCLDRLKRDHFGRRNYW